MQRFSGSRSVTTRRPRRRPRLDPTQLLFVILASLIVCSLVGVTVGTVVVDYVEQSRVGDTAQENPADPNADLAADLRATVETNPDNTRDVLLFANLLANTGQLSEAIDWYERVLAAEPDNVDARLDFARSLADGGLAADAELQFQQVIQRAPRNQQAHYYLGELYRFWEPPRTAEAIREYQTVIELDETTFIGQRSREVVQTLGAATPSPVARPATPAGVGTP